MTARTTGTRTLLDCPACKKPISADLVFDVKLGPIAHPEGEPLSLLQAPATALGAVLDARWTGTGALGEQLPASGRLTRQPGGATSASPARSQDGDR